VHRLRISEIYLLDHQRDVRPRLQPEDLGDACTEDRMSKTPAACLMNCSFPT